MSDMTPGESLLRQLRALGERSASGRLDVSRPPSGATLQLQDGVIVGVTLEGRGFLDALFEILAWDSPELTWRDGGVAAQPAARLTIDELAALWSERCACTASGAEPEIAGASPGVAVPALDRYDVAFVAVDSRWRPSRYEFGRPLKPSYTLGSAAHCDIRMHHPSVRPVHCGLMIEDDFIRIWDLGSHNATHVNGELTDQAILKSGDTVRIGDIELRLVFRLRRPDLRDRTATQPIEPPSETDIEAGPLRYETIRKSRGREGILSRIFRARPPGEPSD